MGVAGTMLLDNGAGEAGGGEVGVDAPELDDSLGLRRMRLRIRGRVDPSTLLASGIIKSSKKKWKTEIPEPRYAPLRNSHADVHREFHRKDRNTMSQVGGWLSA